jgi:hypothetical protein
MQLELENGVKFIDINDINDIKQITNIKKNIFLCWFYKYEHFYYIC